MSLIIDWLKIKLFPESHNSFVLTATAVDGLRSFRIFPFVCHDKETTLNAFLNNLSEQLEVHHPNPEVNKHIKNILN